MTFYSFYRNTVFIQRDDCIDWICIGNNKLQIWELRFNLRAVTVRCVRSSRPVVGDTVKGIIQNSIFKMPDIPMNMTVHAELNPLSCCSAFPNNLLQVVNISESARAGIERLMRKNHDGFCRRKNFFPKPHKLLFSKIREVCGFKIFSKIVIHKVAVFIPIRVAVQNDEVPAFEMERVIGLFHPIHFQSICLGAKITLMISEEMILRFGKQIIFIQNL